MERVEIKHMKDGQVSFVVLININAAIGAYLFTLGRCALIISSPYPDRLLSIFNGDGFSTADS